MPAFDVVSPSRQQTAVSATATVVFYITSSSPVFTFPATTHDWTLNNVSSTRSVWVGTSAVTHLTGLQVAPGESVTFTGLVRKLYAITQTSTATVNVALATVPYVV